MAIGLPSHFYPFPQLQFGCAYALAHEHATLALRTLLQCHQIGIPIRIIEELRKRIERRKADEGFRKVEYEGEVGYILVDYLK